MDNKLITRENEWIVCLLNSMEQIMMKMEQMRGGIPSGIGR